MSAQFGKWNFDDQPIDRRYLEIVQKALEPYGSDYGSLHNENGLSVCYQAFHSTAESRKEVQPHITRSGAIVTWDGRLDNRTELIAILTGEFSDLSTDVAIVAAAYEKWEIDCLGRLIGDWALSIVQPKQRSLLLARDPIGARHLFYWFDHRQISWSTILDPLVLLAGRAFDLSEEYIAGWFSYFPAVDSTPYVGIRSVPPSSVVRLADGKLAIEKFWDFDPEKRIYYASDADYEEHFRAVFRESVRRRLRSDTPILAELSGGIDSSSIVCVADSIISEKGVPDQRLDTVSYYDDSEPNWNERPFFGKVEQRRGRVGHHINIRSSEFVALAFEQDRFAATPNAIGLANEISKAHAACLLSNGNRVVLSGVGGDEVAGGVPTPIPELADLVAACRWLLLADRLKAWALFSRKPWLGLLWQTLAEFLPIVRTRKHLRTAPWLTPGFIRRNRATFNELRLRSSFFGVRLSFQENLSALELLRRQLNCVTVPREPTYERRYPFLDRDLLEFLFAIPREQLVRPGQRRSLMRRALAGIIPEEILGRRRKAYIARSPIASLLSTKGELAQRSASMILASLGIIDLSRFLEALKCSGDDNAIPVISLKKTLGIELWLRALTNQKLLTLARPSAEVLRVSSFSESASVS